MTTDSISTHYLPSQRLRDLVDDNNLLLLVISRFSIPLGFGDSTIREICRENRVDCDTFMAVANLIAHHDYSQFPVSLSSLMGYLENAHSYFLDFILPTIREKLIKAINCYDVNDVGFLILKYYDDYVMEVRNHMEYENQTIFPYISRLLVGDANGEVSLHNYSLNHDSMVEKLQELKDIVIRHYRHKDNNMLNYALYDIINCEDDLMSHCEIEDKLFLPAAMRLEKKVKAAPLKKDEESKSEDMPGELVEALSQREKEIISLVARGMANKEIADKLCLSIHTVTTYRRNIASKLQIHSSAGLTIFAILHNLIDIKDIHLQ